MITKGRGSFFLILDYQLLLEGREGGIRHVPLRLEILGRGESASGVEIPVLPTHPLNKSLLVIASYRMAFYM